MSISICVPVYNDREALFATLDGLRELDRWAEQNALSEQIEVIISDNCSSDGSWELLSETTLNSLSLTKHRQATNLGFRGNLEFLAKQASGDWVFYATCGDVVIGNRSLMELMRNLSATKQDSVFYDFEMLDSATGSYFGSSTQNDMFIESQSETLFSPAPYPLFRRVSLVSCISSIIPQSGNWWPQVEWAIALNGVNHSAGYFNGSIMKGSRPEKGWWSRPNSFEATLQLTTVLLVAAKTQANSAFWHNQARKTMSSLPSWVFQDRCVFRNQIDYSGMRRLVRHFFPFPIESGLALVVALTPLPLLQLARTAKNALPRKVFTQSQHSD